MSFRRSTALLDLPPEIVELILDACSFDSLAKLALVSMETRSLALNHCRADLRRRLSFFVDDIDLFFQALRNAEGVLYGSFVIAYLLRAQTWSCYSLGIKVSEDSLERIRMQTFLTAAGYVAEDIPRDDLLLFESEETWAPQCRFHFVSRRNGARIHIKPSKTFSPLIDIARSWSSLHFAYIDADCVFCAYPQLLSYNVAYLSPSVSASPSLLYNYNKFLERNVVFSANDPASTQAIVTGRKFLDRETRSHDDGGCLWLPLQMEDSSSDVPGWTRRLLSDKMFSVLRWRWPRMETSLRGSVDAVVEH